MDYDIEVNVCNGFKCPRCYHVHHAELNYDKLCDRCVWTMINNFPNHQATPHIILNKEWQLVRYDIAYGEI